MRGRAGDQGQLFFTINVESRIRRDHPLRSVKKTVDRILESMSPLFDKAYSNMGRPGVPPERLLKALLLMSIYSVRSERQLVERIDTDLLFRWFLDMSPEEIVFDATAFTHNRPRMDEFGITAAFFDAVVRDAINAGLCSDDHFSVDGTLIDSMASMKSFRSKDEQDNDDHDDANSFMPRNPDVNFHGTKRSNDTHSSRTDPEARLYRKGPGKPSRLAHMGYLLTENRNGLIMEVDVTAANGTAERESALSMLDRFHEKYAQRPKTLGADAGYDAGEFLIDLESRNVQPHVAMRKNEPADPETIRKPSRKRNCEARMRMRERLNSVCYTISQRVRKKIEECFGWQKTIAGAVGAVGRTAGKSNKTLNSQPQHTTCSGSES